MRNMEILKIVGLEKQFGKKRVLNGLSLSIPEHSIYGFVGKNGAGKTTTLKSVLGLIHPDGGEIFVCSEKVRFGQAKTNRHIGYLPDVPEYYPYMTAMEYMLLCGSLCSLEPKACRIRSGELLELVGLEGEKHRIGGFSRGMKQRLGIAQALLHSPRLLICDEPTSALDPVGRKEILDILHAAKEQTTILFSTHILADVERICTSIAFLNDGVIALEGDIAEVRRRYAAPEYRIELSRSEDTAELASLFPDLIRSGRDTLRFTGDRSRLAEILRCIADRDMEIRQVAGETPSLENIFMKVIR